MVEEGGKWDGNEARRIERLLQAIELGAKIVDIEYNAKNVENIIRLIKKRADCLLSFHDFQKTPSLDVLKQIVNKELKAGADICKVVTTAQTFEDNLAVMRLFSEFPGCKDGGFCDGHPGFYQPCHGAAYRRIFYLWRRPKRRGISPGTTTGIGYAGGL